MPLSKGVLLDGRHGSYKVLTLVHRGGMGVIWRGKALTGRFKGFSVAIKEPRLGGPNPVEKCVEGLVKEIKVLRDISHSNIVRYFDDGTVSGYPVLIMEFVRGEPLSGLVKERGPLSEDVAVDVAVQVLDALQYLHSEKHILLRDVNPKNMMVLSLRPARIKLIDLGLAVPLRIETAVSSEIVHYSGFTAPELAEKGVATPKTDLYGVAALLFFMVTGRPPKDGGSRDPFNDPRKHARDISEELANIIVRGLDSPWRRYNNAEEFKEALLSLPVELVPREVLAPLTLLLEEGEVAITGTKAYIGRKPDTKEVFLFQEDGSAVKIAVDRGYYVSRYQPEGGRYGQVRILRKDGKWYVEQVSRRNSSAVGRGDKWGVLERVGSTYQLRDGDKLALAYKEGKPPYITLTLRVGC